MRYQFVVKCLSAACCLAATTAWSEVVVKDGETIVFLGDSITERGVDNSRGYVNLVMKGLELAGVRAKMLPVGVSNDRSGEMVARLDRDILKRKDGRRGQWLFVSCGVNDVGNQKPLDEYRKNMTAIFDRCAAAGYKIVVLTPTMISENVEDPRNKAMLPFLAWLKDEAKRRQFLCADLNTIMRSRVGKGPGLTCDGLHMSDEGDRMMAWGVLETLGVPAEKKAELEKAWRAIPKKTVRFSSEILDGGLSVAWLKLGTDKPAVTYKAGEEIVVTFTLEDAKWGADKYYVDYVREGDDGVKEHGRELMTRTGVVYRTCLKKPGFLFITARLLDEKGRLAVKARSPEGICVYGGAGADIDKLEPGPEPKDFDEFWACQRARLKTVPMKAERRKVDETDAFVCYAVSIDAPGLRPATGYLYLPKDVAQGQTYPVKVGLHGHGFSPHRPSRFYMDAKAKKITFDLNAHGMRLEAFGADADYYKAFDSEIKSNGLPYACDPKQNADPVTAYFNGMMLRLLRTLEYVKTVEGWNGKDLEVGGWSQGGLQSMWAAGSGMGVTRVNCAITWCCDVNSQALGRYRNPGSIRYAPGLDYYDAVAFARRVPPTCTVDIYRAGLGDTLCLPSGLARLYNVLRGPKKIRFWQGWVHTSGSPDYPGRDTIFSTLDEK